MLASRLCAFPSVEATRVTRGSVGVLACEDAYATWSDASGVCARWRLALEQVSEGALLEPLKNAFLYSGRQRRPGLWRPESPPTELTMKSSVASHSSASRWMQENLPAPRDWPHSSCQCGPFFVVERVLFCCLKYKK